MEFHFFVLSRCTSRQNEETRKRRNGISFLRFSFCRVVQVAKTKKWISFLRFVALFKAPKRTNTKMKYQNFISSFVRFVALYKSPKRFVALVKARQNDKVTAKYQSLIFRGYLFVLSFIRFVDFHKAPKRQRDKMRFCGHFVLSFVHFVALYKSLKRRNEISFWRLFVLSPFIRRQNEQMKWPYPASIQNIYIFIYIRSVPTRQSQQTLTNTRKEKKKNVFSFFYFHLCTKVLSTVNLL